MSHVITDDTAGDSYHAEPQWRQALRRRLLAWFARHARDLPWRRTRDPYRIWVSEVMLQQTQVATVVPYFERFEKRFPDVTTLAASSERDVLRLWEGLGYYRRARQLHNAAKLIVAQHDGDIPAEIETLVSLPGIGRYTAGAILSIAFDQRHPILEANTIRLLSRLVASRHDPRGAAGQKVLWSLAEDILPRKRVGDFNQALMELGSEICAPSTPKCAECPVASLCASNRLSIQAEIPTSQRKTQYEDVKEVCVVVWRGGKVLLRQCRDDERWAGLWDFVRLPMPTFGARQTGAVVGAVVGAVAKLTGLHINIEEQATTMRYGVTRFRIQLDCYNAKVLSGRLSRKNGTLRWVRPEELAEFPLSVTGRKIGSRIAREGPRPQHGGVD